MFRFIDDLNAVIDGGEFGNNFKDIYPEQLKLNTENLVYPEASFLDLEIKFEDGKFIVGLLDKRDHFPFRIVRTPCKSSNLPSNIFYSGIRAETLPNAKANNNINSFYSSVKPLIHKIVKQGAQNDKLSNVLFLK